VDSIGLGSPPAPRPPPGTTAGRLFLSPVSLGLLVQVIVIAVEDNLACDSAGKLARTPFLHDGNVPSGAVPSGSRARPSIQDVPPEGCISSDRWPHKRVFPSRLVGRGGSHGVRCRQTLFMKQVSRLMDSPDPSSWPRRRSRSSELEERPGHGPDPRFLCPTGRVLTLALFSRHATKPTGRLGKSDTGGRLKE
jgi:hypothetical protein